jgi:ribokinase
LIKAILPEQIVDKERDMTKKIVCLGSFMTEFTCRTDRLPVPGETLISDYFYLGPGGKGSNQAVAAKRAGGNVVLMLKVGNDLHSAIARENFKRESFDEKYLVVDTDGNPTGIAIIIVDKITAENSMVVMHGACGRVTEADIALLRPEIESCNIFLTQLETNVDAVEKAIQIAYNHQKTIVLNTAPARQLSPELLSKVTIVTPNEVEAAVLTKVEVTDKSSAGKAAHVFFDCGIQSVIITLGKKGCYVNDGKREAIIDAIAVQTVDTTGAGDAFTGGLVTALAEDKPLLEAARFATVTAALSTTKMGTAPVMPYRAEIDELFQRTYGNR